MPLLQYNSAPKSEVLWPHPKTSKADVMLRRMTAQSVQDFTWKLISALGGFAIVVAALSAWLSRIWAERILEKDRQHYREELERLKSTYEATNKSVQAELDKITHVYRALFEIEFKALSEIWAKIADLRSDMAGLRPAVDFISPEGEDGMEKYRQRLLVFSATLAELKGVVFRYAPFYSEEIYERLMSVLEIAMAEEIFVGGACREGKISPQWTVQGKNHLDALVTRANVVSDAIRVRLRRLSPYPN